MITAGSPVVFEGSIYLTTATKLATDKYVVCYGDSGDSVKGKCVAVIVSGTTPAEGAEATFETVRMRQSSATQLDTDKFALAWDNQDDDRGKTRIGTVSGDTISFAGASSTCALTDTNSPNAIAIDNDDFVIVYEDETDGEQGKSVYAQVSGTTITPGTPEVFYNRNTSLPKIALISSKKVVVSYINQRLGPNQGQVIIGIIQEVDADDTHQGQMEVKGGTMQIKGNNYQVK